MPARKLRVFLSYASPDRPIVREVYHSLLATGWIDPWLDEENLLPGQDFDLEIEKAVHSTDAVIVFISSNSVPREGYIQRELRYVLDIALEKPEGTIFVIPLRLEEILPPWKLRSWHYVDYFLSTSESQSFYKLTKSLKARAEELGIWTGETQHTRGVVKSTPPGKYYGFITEENIGRQLFVHFTDVIDPNQRLVEGERVEFDIQEGSKGLQAIQVKRILEVTPSTLLSKEATEELIAIFASEFREANKREFTFLLLGRTGVGKSSTVNTLIGKPVAEVGDFRPKTFTVKYYRSEIRGVKFSIVDTPGLCDGLPQRSKDKIYLREIKEKVGSIDCVWFTTPLPESRVGRDELEGISQVTEVFGKEIWERAVIVFTKADLVLPAHYARTFSERTEVLVEALSEFAGRDIAMGIPSVAVSNVFDSTPDRRLWLGELYSKVFAKISKQGALPFFLATADRLVRADGQVIEEVKTELPSPDENQIKRKKSQLNSQNTYSSPPSQKIELDETQQDTIKNRLLRYFEPKIEFVKEHPWSTLGFVIGTIVDPILGFLGAMIGFALDPDPLREKKTK